MISDYRELVVWQKAMELAAETYKLVKLLPKEETYSLSDQMRRAAVSIPSNIAEGNGRVATKEYIHFLAIARGSKAELETQVLLGIQIGYFTHEQTRQVQSLLKDVGCLLTATMKKLQFRT